MPRLLFFSLLITVSSCKLAKLTHQVVRIPIADAWAGNSVNTVIFRHNSVTSFKNVQYTAFYNGNGHVVVAKRILPSHQWMIKITPLTGNVRDAHKSISMMVDGAGYLHIVWGQHNNHLHYVRSIRPGSLDFTHELPMTGDEEAHVTYPEFYRMADGNLLFLYREGGSGNGNLVMNYYNIATRQWIQLHKDLIDGEGKRNAYWQCAIDNKGYIHLSWVWRETPNVATNHDICYAVSKDGGKTWQKTDGTTYKLPITKETAEYALHIPEHSDLINQTSMCVDQKGNPYIATYWRKKGTDIPQYYLVYYDGKEWRVSQVGRRTTSFSLEGSGTKHIPISRPQIMTRGHRLLMVFRDNERGGGVSFAMAKNNKKKKWKIRDAERYKVGMWEPTYDIERWKNNGILDLFVEKVIQKDAEGVAMVPPQPAYILECKY